MNILVTGGSGFLGKHLITSLLNEEYNVTVIGREEIKGSGIRWIKHDLLHQPPEEIRSQLKDIDTIVHLAAIMPSKTGEESEMIIQNRKITQHALSLVALPKKVILASSVDVYPYLDTPVDEKTPLNPSSLYGQSKKESEEECMQWSKSNPQANLTILRFSHLYGPADTNIKMIDSLVRNALLGKKNIIYNNGKDKRTYLFVEDAVQAILLSLKKKKSGIFNVGGSNSYSIKEVITYIEEILGVKMNLEIISNHKISSKKGSSIVSSQKFAEAIGFTAKIDLQKGLGQLLPKNILFDLDGPVLDVKERYYFNYKNFVLLHRGNPLSLEKYWEKKRQNTSLERLLDLSDCPGLAAEKKLYLSKHREEMSSLKLDKLQPDIKEILSNLSKRYDLYLITLRRNKENLLKQLGELGILTYFRKVLTTTPTTEDKWNHKVELLKEHQLEKKSGIIIGDTPTEILAGKKVGLTSIAVSHGIRTKENLLQAEPDLIINSVEELQSLPFFKR